MTLADSEIWEMSTETLGFPPIRGYDADLVTVLRRFPWYSDEPSKSFLPRARKMIQDAECQMLHWLAAKAYTGCGDIVDLGAFLGASTEAFGHGARGNLQAPFGRRTIHSFDLFLCARDQYSEELIGHGRRPGDPILDLFEGNILEISDLVKIYPGDVRQQTYRGGDIEILFVDIAKENEINDYLLDNFFSRLIGPGAVVIHQDYNHPWLPWVHWTAHAMRPYSEYICDISGTRVQVITRPPPRDLWVRCRSDRMSREERYAALNDEIEQSENRYSAAMVAMSLAWLTFLEEGLEAGLAKLDEDRQPLLKEQWVPEQVTLMRKSMAKCRDLAGYRGYQRELFTAQPSAPDN